MAVNVYLSNWEETTRWGRRCFVPELAVEGESFAVIDLRPDKGVADGLCLFARVDDGTGAPRPTQRPGRGPLVGVGAMALGDRGETLGPVARRLLGNRLGMDLSAIEDMKMFLAEMLHVAPLLGKVNGGRPIVVPTRGRRLEAYLGGEKVHDIPAVAGGAVTDSFTYSNGNLSTVGSASWADVVGTVQVVSNHCQNTAAFGFDVAKNKTAMSNGDHYAQAVASTLTGSSGAYNFMGVRIRQSNVADNAIHFEAGWAAGTTQNEFNMLVFTAGTPSAIGNWISTDQVTGYPMPARPFTLRIEGNGSSLSGYAVGTHGPLNVTDSTYSTNTYTGIMAYTEGGTTLVQIDDFQADSLATTITPSTVAAVAGVGAPALVPAWAFIGASAQVAASGASQAATLPTGYKTGDLLVAVIAGRPIGTAGSNDTISLDQSWSQRGSRVRREIGTSDLSIEVWIKVATSASETAPTVTVGSNFQGTTAGYSVQIAAFRGNDSTPTFDVSDVTSDGAAAATFTPTGLSPVTASTLVLSAVASGDDNALGYSNAQGFSDAFSGASYDTTTGADHAVALAYKVTGTGAVTMPTFSETAVGNDAWVAISLAVRANGSATNATATPSTVAAVAAVPAPTVKASGTAAPSTVAAVAGVGSPTISLPRTISATTVAAVAGVGSPTITASGTATPSTVAAVAGVGSPTISLPRTISATTVAAVAGVGSPTITASGTATPSTVAAVAAVPAPTVKASGTAAPSTVAAVAAIGSPTITASGTATPSTVAAVAAVGSPSISTGSSQSIAPSTVVATAGVGAPVLRADGTISVSTVSAVASIGSPTITASGAATPSTVAAVAAVGSPTIVIGTVAAPSTVVAIAAVGSPTIITSPFVTPTTVAAIAAVGAPVLKASALIGATTVGAVAGVGTILLVSGGAPTLRGPLTTRAGLTGQKTTVGVETGARSSLGRLAGSSSTEG